LGQTGAKFGGLVVDLGRDGHDGLSGLLDAIDLGLRQWRRRRGRQRRRRGDPRDKEERASDSERRCDALHAGLSGS
jgi:hypothetical protein